MKICEMDTQGKNKRQTVFESTGDRLCLKVLELWRLVYSVHMYVFTYTDRTQEKIFIVKALI